VHPQPAFAQLARREVNLELAETPAVWPDRRLRTHDIAKPDHDTASNSLLMGRDKPSGHIGLGGSIHFAFK
jgi:hypothetical protein